MGLIFADFETFYSDEYSLKKMTPVEYILDSRFEALGCAFAVNDQPAFWVDGPNLPEFFESVAPAMKQTTIISHNALFDALIMAFRYSTRPKTYGCTLSMARNWIAHQIGSVSLESCAKRYGLSPKMDTLKRTKGVNFHAMVSQPDLHREVKTYGVDDVNKCRFLYNTFLQDGFPVGQLEIVDWVVRMAAIPQLELDACLVAEHLGEVVAHKQKLLDDAKLDTRDPLMRDQVLAAALTMLGVNPVPRKISKTTGKEQWAFAKTDKDFTDLKDHPNPEVQALVAARIGHKSTLEETRAQRLLAISRVTVRFPVPLKYSGAHTHRFSGDWSINLQNLLRGGKLRKAIRAPKGCVIVAVDASQIEARFNATLSGEAWLIEAFAKNEDVYADFASVIYNRPIVKSLHPEERYVGKTAILSLGYGSSWLVFQAMVRNKSDGKTVISDTLASNAVMLYRGRCPKIIDHWKVADRQILPMIAQGAHYQWGALEVGRETLRLPNGNYLRYTQLRHEFSAQDDRFQWTYMRGAIPQKIYGAKLVENECQSLAFVHIEDVAMRVKKISEGLLIPVHQVHDELLYVVPENIAEQVRDLVVAEMAKAPIWLPDAPLAAEGHIGETYGDAK